MWPYITEAVNKEASNQLPPLIKASKPTWMGDITLHKCVLARFPTIHASSHRPFDGACADTALIANRTVWTPLPAAGSSQSARRCI